MVFSGDRDELISGSLKKDGIQSGKPPAMLPLIFRQESIEDAIVVIDSHARGIALVVDEGKRLLGTVTDGDVRRAILSKVDLKAPVSSLLVSSLNSPNMEPVTAPLGTKREKLLLLMKERSVRQIPILDGTGRVADLITMDELLPDDNISMQAVIMAGGMGTRLHPLTENMPKPMLPVGGRPLMEKIVDQLQQAGVRRVNITTHFKPEKIIEHFGDGRAFGVELNYVKEEQPLGTGGFLGLIGEPKEPLLVINGDILTDVNFRAMLDYHKDHKADMTVAVRHYEMQVPYGVIDCDGPNVRCLREKPNIGFFVNAGIYLLEPSVYRFIPSGKHFNITDLIQWLLNAGNEVVSFPIREYWLDIGMHSDYAQAQTDFEAGRFKI